MAVALDGVVPVGVDWNAGKDSDENLAYLPSGNYRHDGNISHLKAGGIGVPHNTIELEEEGEFREEEAEIVDDEA